MTLSLVEAVSRPAPLQQLRAQFSGYLFEPTGYGTAARGYLRAFHRAGIQISAQSRSQKDWRPVDDPLAVSLLNRPLESQFCICHSEPVDLAVTGWPMRDVIALTTWESELLPDAYRAALNKAREVWTPSQFNVESFRRQLDVPVFHLPHVVNPPRPTLPPATQIDLLCGLDASDFVFLTVATWQERKNLAGTIEAFFRAFPEESGVKLVIKTSFRFTPAATAVARISQHLEALRPRIDPLQIKARLRIIDAAWTDDRMAALLRRASVYVSLHRGEGWCYPLFDAACAGTPVIATGYSGPMDYLSPEHHSLVRHHLVPVNRGDDPVGFQFNSSMLWADPDLADAARCMRLNFSQYGEACQRAEQGAKLLRQNYSAEAVGGLALERLQFLAGKC